jgi:hypothetical protein
LTAFGELSIVLKTPRVGLGGKMDEFDEIQLWNPFFFFQGRCRRTKQVGREPDQPDDFHREANQQGLGKPTSCEFLLEGELFFLLNFSGESQLSSKSFERLNNNNFSFWNGRSS